MITDRSTLRVAIRTLGRHKGFTTVAVLSLAVAIALNTVMYSVLDALVDPQINVVKPEQLLSVSYYGNFRRQLDPATVEKAMLDAAGSNITAVTGATQYRTSGYYGDALAENGPRYKRLPGALVVRPNYFDVLGARPVAGRTFRRRDPTDAANAAVISDRLANKLFPDESPIGKTFTLNGNGFTIIGLIQRNSAYYPLYWDVYVLPQDNTTRIYGSLVRVAHPMTHDEITRMLQSAATGLAQMANETGLTAFRVRDIVIKAYKLTQFHWALIGAVAAVLLVACANLANLQLARGLARSKELALRAAVGASRSQLVKLLVLESGLLAALGLLLGVFATFWGIHLVGAWIPDSLEFDGNVVAPQVSWSMFLFATLAAIVCLFLVGLIPALRISRVDPNDLLKAGAGTGAHRHHRRRYGAMVVAQIGFALPVLIGAIILLKAAFRTHSDSFLLERYGYDPKPLVRAMIPFYGANNPYTRMDPRLSNVLPRGSAATISADLLTRSKLVPGVIEATAAISKQPVKKAITVDDKYGDMREEPVPLWSYRIVTAGYRTVFHRPLTMGRDFTDGDLQNNVVLVDLPTANFLWPHQNPVGRSVKFGNKDADLPWFRVIGVIGDLRDTATIRRFNPGMNFQVYGVYRLMKSTDSLELSRFGMGTLEVIARVDGNSQLASVRMQRQFRGFRTNLPPSVTPMVDQLGIAEGQERSDFVGSLFSVFGFLGLALVAVGVFGIVAHSVEERRRELAVRISFGATARDILYAVLREGNALILGGVAIGLLFTKYTIWWLEQFILENDPYNAPLMAVIAVGLFAVAAFAAYIPALRATRIDPVEALRHE